MGRPDRPIDREGRRCTVFEEREDGMLERWESPDGGVTWALSGVQPPTEPDEDQAKPAGGAHRPECRVVPSKNSLTGEPVNEGLGVIVCADDCPELARAIERGCELAARFDW